MRVAPVYWGSLAMAGSQWDIRPLIRALTDAQSQEGSGNKESYDPGDDAGAARPCECGVHIRVSTT